MMFKDFWSVAIRNGAEIDVTKTASSFAGGCL